MLIFYFMGCTPSPGMILIGCTPSPALLFRSMASECLLTGFNQWGMELSHYAVTVALVSVSRLSIKGYIVLTPDFAMSFLM